MRGVSGGVVAGIAITLPELAAARPGTLPPIRVGFVSTAEDDCVATDEVELERAGDWGGALTKDAVGAGGGEGAVKDPEFRWLWKGDGGAKAPEVGVNAEGFWTEGVPVADVALFLSPGASKG